MIAVRKDDPNNPALARLLAAHVAEQHGAVPPGFAFALDARGLSDPAVTFWSAWDGERVVGMGALKELDATAGEVKSMRADAAWRGKGVGHAVLSAIVAEARARAMRACPSKPAPRRPMTRRWRCTGAQASLPATPSPTIARARTTSF